MPIQTLKAARNIDFAPSLFLDYEGDEVQAAGASVSMEIRLYPGAAGAALAADTSVDFTEAAHPSRAGWRRLTLQPVILKAVLASLPGQNTPTPGDTQTFVHEIKITYADDQQETLLIGEFVLAAGVNRA